MSENWLVNWRAGINLCISYKWKSVNRLLVYRGITVSNFSYSKRLLTSLSNSHKRKLFWNLCCFYKYPLNTEGILHDSCGCVSFHCWGDLCKSLWVPVVPLLSKPSSNITWVQDTCRFVGKQTIGKSLHPQYRLGLMYFLRKTINFPLAIAMVTIAKFFQKVHSYGFADDRFNRNLTSSMKQSPCWESYSRSRAQEIPFLLCNS
jgi:hypothetical protein